MTSFGRSPIAEPAGGAQRPFASTTVKPSGNRGLTSRLMNLLNSASLTLGALPATRPNNSSAVGFCEDARQLDASSRGRPAQPVSINIANPAIGMTPLFSIRTALGPPFAHLTS